MNVNNDEPHAASIATIKKCIDVFYDPDQTDEVKEEKFRKLIDLHRVTKEILYLVHGTDGEYASNSLNYLQSLLIYLTEPREIINIANNILEFYRTLNRGIPQPP